jgi:hypothetical protein
VFVGISERGSKVLKQLDEPLQALQQKLLGHLNRKELSDLSRTLEKARQETREARTD